MAKKISQFLIIILLLVGIGIVLKNIYFSIKSKQNINKEVMALKEEANKFDQENKNLNKLINYFNSQDFQEKEIKNKLNLVKNGERVVVIRNGGEQDIEKDTRQQNSRVVTRHANYYYWWKYFFAIRDNG